MKTLCYTILAALCLAGVAQAADAPTDPYDQPVVGEYVNDAGILVIAPAAAAQNANYDILIQDKSGKCSIQIVSSTWQATEQEGVNGAVTHPRSLATVKSEDFPNFSLWPKDNEVRLSEDALPLDKLDPACAVFKDNLVFTRK